MNISNIIREEIDKCVSCLYEANKYTERRKKDLERGLMNKVSVSDELKDDADRLGINLDWSSEGERDFRDKHFNPDNSFKDDVVGDINEKHKAAIRLLKQYTSIGSVDSLVPGGAVNLRAIEKELKEHPEQYAGLTFNEFCRIKDNLDLHSLRGVYDPSYQSARYDKFGTKGVDGGETEFEDFNFNTITDKQLRADKKFNDVGEEETRAKIRRVTADKFMMTHYGIKMEVPGFSLGNQKVKNAMIINFTAAMKCPAWDECLVKHACYARSGEVRHPNAKASNDRKNLIWLSTKGDIEMMKLVHNYLLSILIHWGLVEKNIQQIMTPEFVSSVENVSGQSFDKPKKSDIVDAISQMWCSDMEKIPGLIDFLKPFVRVNDIRVNENGDFINQEMLEEFDTYIAGEFGLLGVQSAAYSCRNLQFGKIKNIIINASRTAMDGSAIERYFVALPTFMYDKFDDTFENYQVKSDTKGSIGELRKPKPLYKVVRQEDGTYAISHQDGFYYKCPCAREDFKIGKNNEDYTVNCYNCHMCYEPSNEVLGNGQKLYVFVKAHGSEKEYLGRKREKFVMNTIGVSENYLELRDTQWDKEDVSESRIAENVEMGDANLKQDMENEAINVVVDNATMSMTEHFRNIGKQRDKFNEMFERLNNTTF